MRWRKLTLADKVETTRTIPMSAYLRQILASLPRVNAYVFASVGSPGALRMSAQATGRHCTRPESRG